MNIAESLKLGSNFIDSLFVCAKNNAHFGNCRRALEVHEYVFMADREIFSIVLSIFIVYKAGNEVFFSENLIACDFGNLPLKCASASDKPRHFAFRACKSDTPDNIVGHGHCHRTQNGNRNGAQRRRGANTL